MGWLPSFASEQAPSGQQRSALALSGPVVLLALGIGWRARFSDMYAPQERRILGPLWADRAEANIQVKSPRCLL
jgi:hypothetical protein